MIVKFSWFRSHLSKIPAHGMHTTAHGPDSKLRIMSWHAQWCHRDILSSHRHLKASSDAHSSWWPKLRWEIIHTTHHNESHQKNLPLQSLPLGVPPFRKLSPPKFSSRKGSVSSQSKVPDFQALPSSITSQQLVQPTKIEYYPKESYPDVDLKGHTVAELAAIAGVSEEYIRTAIKIRQQQMMKEKLNPSTTSPATVQPPISKSPTTTTSRSTTRLATEKLLLVTPSSSIKSPSIDEEKYINHKKETKLSMPKKKAHNTKKVVHYGQKVSVDGVFM